MKQRPRLNAKIVNQLNLIGRMIPPDARQSPELRRALQWMDDMHAHVVRNGGVTAPASRSRTAGSKVSATRRVTRAVTARKRRGKGTLIPDWQILTPGPPR